MNFESRQSRIDEVARKHSLQDEVDGPVNPLLPKRVSQDALAKIEVSIGISNILCRQVHARVHGETTGSPSLKIYKQHY